ncbi:MAG: VOC family protein [Proteobacteria bacterium]|nr:VOC family protein [Pseudomonadota bacterium]
MQISVQPFLMFEGKAEEAMNFYVSLFPEGWITDISRYGPGEQGKEGSVKLARFTLAGQSVMCIDSPVKHAFTFTPAFSFFVDVPSEAELRRLATVLGEGGGVMMPLANYGFSKLFTWVNDRFGVSWQLNWP